MFAVRAGPGDSTNTACFAMALRISSRKESLAGLVGLGPNYVLGLFLFFYEGKQSANSSDH